MSKSRILKRRRYTRRDFLSITGTSAAGALLLPRCTLDDEGVDCHMEPEGAQRSLQSTDTWLRQATIGGMEVFGGIDDCTLKIMLDRLADQAVTVVEVDAELSAYMTDAEYKKQVDLLHHITEGCHQRGMRAVAYFPTLEVLTANAEDVEHTMFKDHPDWVQTSITGEPNMFIGGGGRVFWVDEGEESAWMCPTSGYVDYFTDRVNLLAGTALDGVWGDVPLFSDIVGEWPCCNESCRTRFNADTGLELPSEVNWQDQTFRRWVHWRHAVMSEFEQTVLTRAKAVRADFEVIIETVTMDYNAATIQGLDGSATDDGALYRVWEVDAVSDSTAMRFADKDDWISMAIMMRHGSGCSFPLPSWVFSYGIEEDDAEHVAALTIATGNTPYEAKIPLMNTSVGPDYRKRVFEWIGGIAEINHAQRANRVGVIYLASSRDFLDQDKGVGLYTSINKSDELWWSDRELDSAKELPYLGDYRGCCKALITGNIPYDLIPGPRLTLKHIANYDLLVCPSPVALSNKQAAALESYVKAGGKLVFTGPDAGTYTEEGGERTEPLLIKRLGVDPLTTESSQALALENGFLFYFPKRAGQDYFSSNDASFVQAMQSAARVDGHCQIEIEEGNHDIVFDVRHKAEITYLLCANIQGLGKDGIGIFSPEALSVTAHLKVLTQPTSVWRSSPGSGRDTEIAFTYANGIVTFVLDIERALLIKVVG